MLISTGCKPKQLKTFELSDITEDHVKKKKKLFIKKNTSISCTSITFSKITKHIYFVFALN